MKPLEKKTTDEVANENAPLTSPKKAGKVKAQKNETPSGPALAGHEDDEKQVRELIGGIDAAETEIKDMQNRLDAKRHSSFENALQAGEILCRLKEALREARRETGSGLNWQEYVETCLGCSPKKTSMYMRFHNRRDELEKSEIFPKLGIAQADELLKTPKKSAAVKSTAADDAGAEESGDPVPTETADPDTDPGNTVDLADGEKLALSSVGWEEGVISTTDLVQLLQSAAPSKNRPRGKKVATREQRVIVTIAASINRACRDDDREQAEGRVRSALETMLQFLSHEKANEAA